MDAELPRRKYDRTEMFEPTITASKILMDDPSRDIP
jgi:hypothetical protein